MSPTELSIEQDTDTLVFQIDTFTHSQPAKSTSLRENVQGLVKEYFVRLDGEKPANIYELFLAEVESPLLEIVLRYAGQNQSQAAKYLNLSRGTLRKKMKQYGFLDPQGKRHSRKIKQAEG